MDILVYVGIYACFVLAGLSIVTALGFGVRNVRQQKVHLVSTAVISAPLVMALLLGLMLGDWVKGAVIACVIAFVLALAAVLTSGVRGFFSA